MAAVAGEQRDARRRRFAPKATTTLLALLQAVQGRKLIFELRDDVIVTGRLTAVDDHMNVFVENGVWQPVQGPSRVHPTLFIKGRLLRCVHLPKQLDPITVVDAYIEGLKKQRRQATLEELNKRHGRMGKGAGGSGAAGEGGGGDGAADGGGGSNS